MSVQKYSVQYRGYNLIRVTNVEGGATRGTTALFLDSYLAAYIQRLYRVARLHPTGLTVNQGCRMVSTRPWILYLEILSIGLKMR